MGTPRKIDAILLNIKINLPKLVNTCRYKLATYWQNILNLSENIAKVLGGYFFTHSRRLYKANCHTNMFV